MSLSSIVPHCNSCGQTYSWYQLRCPDCKSKDIPDAEFIKDLLESHEAEMQKLLKDLEND